MRIHRHAPQASGKAWPSRLDVTDERECATGGARLAGKIRALDFTLERDGTDSCEFFDHDFVICGSPAASAVQSYLTSLSNGRRRWPAGGFPSDFGSLDRSGRTSSGSIASHRAFSSASEIRLSFMRSSRMATDTSCAVSRLPPARRTARHSSRVARTESNCSSELATGVFPFPSLRGVRPAIREAATNGGQE